MHDSLLRAQSSQHRWHPRRSVAPARTIQPTEAKLCSVLATHRCEDGCEMLPASPILPNCARCRPTQPEASLRPAAVSVPPFHPPRLASHSTAVSHSPLPQGEENSSAPAYRLCRLPGAAQSPPVVLRTPRPGCLPRPSGISPWIECHQSAGWQRLSPFLRDAQALDRQTCPSRSVRSPSNEVEPARRCPEQCERLRSLPQSRRREADPTRQCRPSRWPEHCELPLSAHNEDTPKTLAVSKWLESTRRVPTASSCSLCGSLGKARGARRVPIPESIQPRRLAVPAVNRRQAMHWRYCLPAFLDSGSRCRQSSEQRSPATEIPAQLRRAHAVRYKCIPLQS